MIGLSILLSFICVVGFGWLTLRVIGRGASLERAALAAIPYWVSLIWLLVSCIILFNQMAL